VKNIIGAFQFHIIAKIRRYFVNNGEDGFADACQAA
jgi:hypothetical protein